MNTRALKVKMPFEKQLISYHMDNKYSKIREKILKGIGLAFQKLVEQKAQEDGELVYDDNEKIVRIKARSLIKLKKL